MSEATTPGSGAEPTPEVRERLLALAGLVRGTGHLAPEARAALADLLAVLAGAMGPVGPGPQADHLAESAAQAARALHERQHGLLTAARERLEAAAAHAEATAPVATGGALRLIDRRSEIGI